MNSSDAESVEKTLEKLGLTSLQARIYVALHFSGKLKTLTVSKIANLDRSNTYRTILQLQNIGLVAKLLGSPNSYQALPLEEAVSILVSHKKSEFHKIQSMAQELVENASITPSDNHSDEYEFKMIKLSKETYFQEIFCNCKNIRESTDLLVSKKTLIESLINLAPNYLVSIKRGIKFRITTEKINQPFILEITLTPQKHGKMCNRSVQ
ncbi:MAG: helix-turn-helix domain-containing protein [Candidatus Bathyarchaeia archaeon]|jgi:sugar-specific transcriptional regulator TrmB